MCSKNDQLICRTCLKVITDNELCASAETYTNFGKVIDILETCVSELNSDLTDNVVLCCNCFTMLGIAYDFKLRCINTEERIFAYMQNRRLSMSNKIDLTEVIKDVNFELESHESEKEANLRRTEAFTEIDNLPNNNSFPYISLDVEDIIRRQRAAKQVSYSFDDEFDKNTNKSSSNMNKLEEYSVIMFDNLPLLNTKTDDLIVRSIEADCNVILENCKLNSTTEEYIDALYDTVSIDEYICSNDLEKIL